MHLDLGIRRCPVAPGDDLARGVALCRQSPNVAHHLSGVIPPRAPAELGDGVESSRRGVAARVIYSQSQANYFLDPKIDKAGEAPPEVKPSVEEDNKP